MSMPPHPWFHVKPYGQSGTGARFAAQLRAGRGAHARTAVALRARRGPCND